MEQVTDEVDRWVQEIPRKDLGRFLLEARMAQDPAKTAGMLESCAGQ